VNARPLLFAATLLAAPSLSLAEEVALALDLRGVAAMAAERNPGLAASNRQIEAAESLQSAARAGWLPRVDVGTTAMRSDSPLTAFGSKLLQQQVIAADFNPAQLNKPAAMNNVQTYARVSLSLFDGGATVARNEQATSSLDSSRQMHEMTGQQLLFDLIAAYSQLRQSQAELAARQEGRKAAEHHLANMQAMARQGMLIPGEVQAAKVFALQAKVAEKSAANAFLAADERLHRLLDLPVARKLELTGDPKLLAPTKSLDELQELAVAGRPDLVATRHQLEVADAGREVARAAFLPQVRLLAEQQWNDKRAGLAHRNTTIAGMVDLNLFSGGRDKATYNAASAEVERQRLQLSDREEQVRFEVADSWRSRELAAEALELHNESASEADEALRVSKLRFAAGLDRASDLLAAQARRDTALAESIKARYALTQAEAQLYLMAGQLTFEVIQ